MITEADIQNAQTEVAAATEDAQRLKPRLWQNLSRDAGSAYAAALGRIELAKQRLKELTDQREDEQRLLAERPKIEKTAAKDIAALGGRLEVSRDTVTAAANAAQQALVDALEALRQHDSIVREAAEDLAARGLTFDQQFDYQTASDGRAARLFGTWWAPVDAGTVLAWLVHQVAAARLPETHRLTGSVKWAYYGHPERRTDGLVERVTTVEQIDRPRFIWPERPSLAAAPVLFESEWARKEAERRAAEAVVFWEVTPNGLKRVAG